MRNTIVATAAVVCLISGSLGCKSAPKLAFWKSGEKSDVESTALAHSAPALPADVAKQAETLANSSPSIDLTASSPAGAQAPPYSPAPPYTPPTAGVASAPAPAFTPSASPAPTAYPSTGAPSYAAVPSTRTTPAATAPAMSSVGSATKSIAANIPPALYNNDKSADLGSVDMPYNPNAVPPAKTVASATATPATPAPSADRYGSGALPSRYAATSTPTTPAFVPSASSPAAPAVGGGSRYGNVTASSTTPSLPPSGVNLASTSSPSVTATSAAPAYTAPAAMASTTPTVSTPSMPPVVDRYASMASSAVNAATASPATPSVSSPVTPTVPPVSSAPAYASAPQVASAQPYRPGGTSTYEGSLLEQSNVEIASRPQTPEATVPNVATPSTPTVEAPRYR